MNREAAVMTVGPYTAGEIFSHVKGCCPPPELVDNDILLLDYGDQLPRPILMGGWVMVSRQWLAKTYPRAWADYVLTGGPFTLVEETNP